jgi:hypothetical protein
VLEVIKAQEEDILDFESIDADPEQVSTEKKKSPKKV